jgi:hypothetical protein
MRIAIIITTQGRTLSTDHLVQSLRENTCLPHDIHVVDHSTSPEGLSARTNLWCPDRQSKGPIWVQNIALNMVRSGTPYDYIWFLNDEAAVRTDTDPVAQLVDILERNPRMAILSPTDPTGEHPGSTPTAKKEWHAATDTAHTGFVIRTQAIDDVGFLNGNLRYCAGAMVEYAYKLYTNGWFVAYADCVRAHQPLTLNPQPGQSEQEAQCMRDRFAFDYMFSNYGWDWSYHFMAATSAHTIQVDGFSYFHQLWAQSFSQEELKIRQVAISDEAPLLVGTAQKSAVQIDEPDPVVDVSINSDARLKLIAWPKFDSAADLETLMGEYGRLLLKHEDIQLCVRHDPERDIEINAACAALSLAHERVIGPEFDLHILLVNDAMDRKHWSTLGQYVDGSLVLPSSQNNAERAAFHQALGCAVYDDVTALRREIAAPPHIPSLEDLFPGMEQLAV